MFECSRYNYIKSHAFSLRVKCFFQIPYFVHITYIKYIYDSSTESVNRATTLPILNIKVENLGFLIQEQKRITISHFLEITSEV